MWWRIVIVVALALALALPVFAQEQARVVVPPDVGTTITPVQPPTTLPAPREAPVDLVFYPGTEPGTYVHEAPGFTAVVYPDGTVRFRDRIFRMAPPWLPVVPRAIPEGTNMVPGTVRDRLGLPSETLIQIPEIPGQDMVPFMTSISRDRPDPGDICIYPDRCFFDFAPVLVAVRVGFDLTDNVLRAVGNDPYRDEKARFLARTGGLRRDMAMQHRNVTMQHALAAWPQHLRQVWQRTDLSLQQRRAIIVQLRDELDLALPEGRQAAAMIDNFVRTHDPQATALLKSR